MIRILFSLLIALGFAISVPAVAQSGQGVVGWQSPSGPSGSFESADEACRAQWQKYMGGSDSRYIGAETRKSDWRFADCKWTRWQYLCPEEKGQGAQCPTINPDYVQFVCATGYTAVFEGQCRANPQIECSSCEPGRENPQMGNPIAIRSGAKLLNSLDYQSPDGDFFIGRSYRSFQVGRPIDSVRLPRAHPRGLVGGWNFSFSYELQLGTFSGSPASPNAIVAVLASDGTGYGFKLQSSGEWIVDPAIGSANKPHFLKLEYIGTLPADLSTIKSSPSDWRLTDREDNIWLMRTRVGPNGGSHDTAWPVNMTRRDGYSWTFGYASDSSLATMTDSYGRTASFSWDRFYISSLANPPAGSKPYPLVVKSIGLPDGTSLEYGYDPAPATSAPSTSKTERLVRIERKDGSGDVLDSITYLYEDARFPKFLTGVIDNRGQRISTYAYDAQGRSILTESAEGTNRFAIEYGQAGSNLTRRVTNSLGKVTNYTFSAFSGAGPADFRLTDLDGEASAHTPVSDSSISYGADTFTGGKTDAEGRSSVTTRDAKGRPTSIVEASGTPDARTTTITWNATFNVPDLIVTPGLTETRTYDMLGRLDTVTLTDTTSQTAPYSTTGQTRTSTFTWDANGRLLSVDGPLPPTAAGDDITSFTYDAQGNLLTATNALGHVVTYSNFGPDGRAGLVTDANGVQTAFGYDGLGRVETITLKHPTDPLQDAVTTMDYDAVGNVMAMTLPGTAMLGFEYDAANRVTAMSSVDGDRWTYSYDAMSNVVSERVKRGDGSTFVRVDRAFDELGRLIRESSGSDSAAAQWVYDRVGNVTSTTSPTGFVTAASFDALDRVVSTVAPDTGTSALTYDAQDNPLSFTDPISVTTQFTYNGLGEVIQEVSPDRGTNTYWYDAAGQLTQSSDGRGQVITYERDLLGRVTKMTPQGRPASEVIEYVWDAGGLPGSYGVGQLARVVDGSGTTLFGYDHRGNLLAKQQAVGTSTAAQLVYQYDSSDRVTQITYPSGRQVRYGYDTKGRVASVETRASSSEPVWQVVSGSYAYEPFGPVKAMLLGNGLVVGNVWGADGALRSRQLTTVATGTDLSHLAYRYDPDGNIGAITDYVTPAASVVYGYDPVGRLVLTVSDTAPVDPQSYSYTGGTNQLSSFTDSSGTRSISYDARGNTISESRPGGVSVAAGYDGYGRLISYDRSNTGLQQYSYNGLDDRVKVVKPTGTRTFVYDADGRVMGEYGTDASDVKAEFIWALPTLAANDNSPFGGGDVTGGYTPLAVASPAGSGSGPVELFWVHGNHLGVPVVYTNDNGTPVAPPGDYLLPGFPGQSRVMADLYNNRYRDYDPVTGRYIQADPIGLGGGANSFIYAGADPVNRIDPTGLFEVDPRYLPRTTPRLPVGLPRPAFSPAGAGFMLIGAIAPTIINALQCALPSNRGQYDDWLIEQEPDDPNDKCEKQKVRDEARCEATTYRYGKWAYKECMSSALRRYNQCRQGIELEDLTGVETPLYRQ